MDIVMITRDRPELTEQCIRSMRENASDWSKHRLVLVYDGSEAESQEVMAVQDTAVYERIRISVERFGPLTASLFTGKQLGVGGAKNYGAKWISSNTEPPGLLMFSDNDMWYAPGWDTRLEAGMMRQERRGLFGQQHVDVTQLGGWRHPFHQIKWPDDYVADILDVQARAPMGRLLATDAVTGNCFVIRWDDWLRYGPFDSNAIGPGQSEDYALSQRIRAGGGLVATLDPPVAIHCGLVNSVGEPATGWRECEQQITEQLAGLSAAMRDGVLIMRPAPTVVDVVEARYQQAMDAPSEYLRDVTARTLDHLGRWPTASESMAADNRALAELLNDASGTKTSWDGERYATYGVLESARKRLDMQPRNAPRQLIAGLNLCSGQRRFDPALGWANLDGQRVPPDRVPDIVWQADEPLPFGDATMSYVAIVHALEHFGCGESVPLLRECHRVLKRGGSLIVVVPDMKRLAARWLSGEISEYIFNVNCYGAYISDERDRHRWSMSRESLPNLLNEAGVWSKIGEFDYREIAGSDFPRDWWMLAMEAVK